MRKKISEMTKKDKAAFLAATIRATEEAWMEARVQAEIDNTFDDEKFVKMDPDSRIDAAYARKEFGDKKPELVDYLLWTLKFVTKSEYVEW